MSKTTNINLIDSLDQPVLTVDANGKIVHYNHSWCEMTQTLDKETLGDNIVDFFEDGTELLGMFQKKAVSNKFTTTLSYNSLRFPVELTIIYEKKIKPQWYILIKNLSFLRQEINPFNQIIEDSLCSIVILENGQIKYLNHSACSLF